MAARIRRLPFLRSRSNVEFGVYAAFLANFVFAFALAASTPHMLRAPSSQLLVAFAGVGGTLFIAYTVGVSNLFRQMRRGSDIETLLGVLTGLGICGFVGVWVALSLLEAHQPLGWLGHLGLCWSAISLAFLGGFVAGLPLLAYDDARVRHLNPEE